MNTWKNRNCSNFLTLPNRSICLYWRPPHTHLYSIEKSISCPLRQNYQKKPTIFTVNQLNMKKKILWCFKGAAEISNFKNARCRLQAKFHHRIAINNNCNLPRSYSLKVNRVGLEVGCCQLLANGIAHPNLDLAREYVSPLFFLSFSVVSNADIFSSRLVSVRHK